MSHSPLIIHAIDHLVFNVTNVDASAAWYVQVLGMTRQVAEHGSARGGRTSVFFGHNKINLRPIDASQDEWFTDISPQPGSDDLCFLTESIPEQILMHLHACHVDVVLGPVIKQGAGGDICSIYVRDPDGNLIEISSYR